MNLENPRTSKSKYDQPFEEMEEEFLFEDKKTKMVPAILNAEETQIVNKAA